MAGIEVEEGKQNKFSITADEDMVDNTGPSLAINEASVHSSSFASESSEQIGGVFKPVTFVHRGEVHPVVYLHESLLSSFTDDEENIRGNLDESTNMEQWLDSVDSANPRSLFYVLSEVIPHLYSQRQIILLANVARTQNQVLRDQSLRCIQLLLLMQSPTPYSSKLLKEAEIAMFSLLSNTFNSQQNKSIVNTIVTYLMTLVSYIMACHTEGKDQECDRHLSDIEGRHLIRGGVSQKKNDLITVLCLCVLHWKKQTCKHLNTIIKTVNRLAAHLKDKSDGILSKEMQLLLHISILFQLHKDSCLSVCLESFSQINQVYKSKDAEDKPHKIIIAHILNCGLSSFLEHKTKYVTSSPSFLQNLKNIMDLLSQSLSHLDNKTKSWALGQLTTLLFHRNKFIRRQSQKLYIFDTTNTDIAIILGERLVLDTQDILYPILQISASMNKETLRNGWKVVTHTFDGHDNNVLTHVLCPSVIEHEGEIRSSLSDEKLNELRLLRELRHPHVVQLQAFNDVTWPIFYITEDYLTSALQTVLVNKSRHDDCFSLKRLFKFLVDAMEGILFLHSNNIVHRDLTAANLFIATNGQVKLSGLINARKLSRETVRDFNCSFIPTRWSAPETLKQCLFSKMSDMWMVGHLIYEVLTHGRLPYADLEKDDTKLMEMVVSGRRTLCEEECIPDAVYEVILHLTKPNPMSRTSEVKDVSNALRLFAEQMCEVRKNVPFPDLCKEGESATDHQKGLVDSIQDTYFGAIEDSLYENMGHLESSVNKDKESLDNFRDIKDVCPENFSPKVWSLLANNYLPGIPPLITLPKISSDGKLEIRFRIPVKSGICSVLSVVTERLLGHKVQDYIQLLGNIATVIKDLHSHNLVLCDFCADTIYIEKSTTPPELQIKVWFVSLAHIHILQPSAGKDDEHIKMSPPQQSDARRRAAPEVVKKGLYSHSSDVFCFARLMWMVFKALSEDKASKIDDSNPFDPLTTIPDSEIYEAISSVNAPSLLERPPVCPTDIYSLMAQCWRPRRSERPSMCVLQEHLTNPTKKEEHLLSKNYEHLDDDLVEYANNLVSPKEEYDESTSISRASGSFSDSLSLPPSRKNSSTFTTLQPSSISQTVFENPSSTFCGEATSLSSSPALSSLHPSQVQILSASQRLSTFPKKEGSKALQPNFLKPSRSSSRVSSMRGRNKSEAIKEYLHDVDDILCDRVRVHDVTTSSRASVQLRSSSEPGKKTFVIRGTRNQILEALRIITIATGEMGQVLEQSQKKWIDWVQQAFPELESRAYFVPPVYIRRVPTKETERAGQKVFMLTPEGSSDVQTTLSVQKSDMLEDEANQRVLFSLKEFSKLQQEVFMCVSQFPFGSYLGEPYFAPAAAHLHLPTNLPKTFSGSWRQGVFDLLLIHKQYGCVIFEIKAVGYNTTVSDKERDKQVVKKLTQAVQQLDKAEAMLSHLVSDIDPSVRITKTIACPNIQSSELQKLISDNEQLQKDLCRCLQVKDSTNVSRSMLCSDHLFDTEVSQHATENLKLWWANCVARPENESPLSIKSDVYKNLIARFCGPASTITVPCVTEPRVSIKTWHQAVSYVGDCYTAHMILFPEQIELLSRAPKRAFIAGPPGTGKTVVLFLMATEWLLKGNNVYVLSIWERSLAAAFMLYHMLEEIIKTQLLDSDLPAQVTLLVRNFKLKEHFEATIDELTLQAKKGPLYVIADEVGPDLQSEYVAFPELSERLLDRLKNQENNLHFWAASCHHTVAPATSAPYVEGSWETTFFTRPLRSPPTVIREIEKSWEIEHCTVPGYSERGVPDATDGPEIKWVIHKSQHHGPQNIEDCDVCGLAVVKELRTNCRIGVSTTVDNSVPKTTESSPSSSVTPPILKYKDVFILSKSQLREEAGILRAFSEKGIPVRVMRDYDIEDVATASSDVVWAARQHLVQGLERKVVVCLDNYDDIKGQYPFSRLYTMSRCSSQLIVVCPPA